MNNENNFDLIENLYYKVLYNITVVFIVCELNSLIGESKDWVHGEYSTKYLEAIQVENKNKRN